MNGAHYPIVFTVAGIALVNHYHFRSKDTSETQSVSSNLVIRGYYCQIQYHHTATGMQE